MNITKNKKRHIKKEEQFGCSLDVRNKLWSKYVYKRLHKTREISFLNFCKSKA